MKRLLNELKLKQIAFRIYTTGFSAGGLWSTWLVMHRSHRIAAAAVFSGGVGGMLDTLGESWLFDGAADGVDPADQV